MGIRRERRPLPWDNDIDLCVTADECDQICALDWHFRRCWYWVEGARLKESMKSFQKAFFDRVIPTELHGKTYWIPAANDDI
ncbi:hypothetical protein ACFL6Q_06465 [Candidatus Neomarinimicrobiota bacterium]